MTWNTNYTDGIKFNCKADAFKWLNEVPNDIDSIYLCFDKETRFIKNIFGIYDCITESYVNGLLPVEYYN